MGVVCEQDKKVLKELKVEGPIKGEGAQKAARQSIILSLREYRSPQSQNLRTAAVKIQKTARRGPPWVGSW